ncbi:hypothetical protein H0H87_002483 [Tephrocybe sp. NHM501043]|nr:hypothetical protein H0H87_002483 [Tephrocybe sp. NHM501043]
MPSILPFELWLKIYEHLPVSLRCKAIRINRALLHIYLEEKYQNVDIIFNPGMPGHTLSKYDEKVSNLQKPFINRHVHHLRLWPQAFIGPTSSHYGRAVRKGRLAHFTPERGQRLGKALKGMTNAKTLEIKLDHSHLSAPQFLPSVLAGWTSMRKSLVKLVLDIPAEAWRLAIHPATVFPGLEVLQLTLWCIYHTTDMDSIMQKIIATFINNHSKSLTDLSIDEPRSSFFHNVDPLLSTILLLPNLFSLKLACSYLSVRQCNTKHLRDLLDLHAESLNQLTLYIRNPHFPFAAQPSLDVWYAQYALHARLPKLRTFDLSLEMFPSAPHTGVYLKTYARSLREVTLLGKFVAWQDVAYLADAFAGLYLLESFTIAVDRLNPPLVVMVKERLPRLKTFAPIFKYLTPVPASSVSILVPFIIRGRIDRVFNTV